MKPIYIFDLDGTLCNIEHRLNYLREKKWAHFYLSCVYDEPITNTISILQALYLNGAEIWFVTGRSAEVMAHTVEWLVQHTMLPEDAIVERLYMRKEGDHRDDDVVKEEWLHAQGLIFRARICAVFEDRDRVVKMWRRNGVTCLQVAEGNF